MSRIFEPVDPRAGQRSYHPGGCLVAVVVALVALLAVVGILPFLMASYCGALAANCMG